MDDGKPLLDLQLWPHRAMERRHFAWVVGGVTILFMAFGIRFLLLGAWPILPFMAVDLLILGWAMHASYRSGHAAERVRLEGRDLKLERVSPFGGRQQVRLDPLAVRVELESFPDARNRLWLLERNRREPLGAFLSPAEREELAGVLEEALRRWRSGAR
jgi:uncharacterized membrane protein